jgi:tetratricopeptide (TPR) repeat protein
VVHRDVKPDNILLEPLADGATRAVLTDFGLARNAVGAPVTRDGTVAGTPGYLAPELLSGGRASAASDLYSFALVLRALVASAIPVLAPRIQAVFARALNAEPTARFESATALVDALTAATAPPWRRWTLRALFVTPAAAVVALSVVAFRIYQTSPAPLIAAASQVLLTNMVNGTSEHDLDGAGEVLRSQLSQSTQFELLEPERVAAALRQMGRTSADFAAPEVAREVALREGVPVIVYASLDRVGAEYQVSVKMEQAGARPSLARRAWTQSFATHDRASLFDAVHDAAVWVRRTAGEVPSALENQDRAPADTTTSSWEALRLFTQADALSAAGRLNDATLLFEQAIQVDPEFAMAETRLGDALISLRRDKEGFAAWQRAVALADHRQLTSREALRIRGQYFDDTGDLVAAEKAYRTYTIHYPNDFYASFFLGSVLVELDRVAEAVPWLEKAAAVRQRSLSAAVHLALAYLDLHRPDDVSRAIARVDALGSTDWSTWLRALTIFTTGDVERALSALEPLGTSFDPQWRSRAYTLRASWLSEAGRDDDALAVLRAGIDFDSSRGLRDRLADKWLHRAELEQRQRDAHAVISARQAIEIGSNAHRLVRATGVFLRAGAHADARRALLALDELAQVPTTVSARHQVVGEMALARGTLQKAVESLTAGLSGARRSESRLPLVRALARSGDRLRAESIATTIAEHPVAIYSGPEPAAPGLWREAIEELAAIVERRDPATAGTIRRRFALLLHASTTAPRVAEGDSPRRSR